MFHEVPFHSVRPDFIRSLNEDWMLVTAGPADNPATMTISWGMCGFIWGQDTVLIMIRESRNTLPYLRSSDMFSLCAFPPEYHDKLYYCGRHSGRDVDKIKVCGLTPAVSPELGDAPYFEEAQTVYLCRPLYTDTIHSECFVDSLPSAVYHQWYETGVHAGDNHRFFIAKIEHTLVK